MRSMKGEEIRAMWLAFFKSKGHEVIPSASLIPVDDPTLLWINAGVAPLKKYFDGREVPANRRMTNAQKSIRTNDIDNVGKTARHHTFFEMLGNFSVGDYFRSEALTWAIELLTSEEWFALPLEKLYFTVYTGDDESRDLWHKLGVPLDHIIPLAGNFWEIGAGPCGPDTEIFFDRGEAHDPHHDGIRLLREDLENDRYIEIWNIVFSQYNAVPGKARSEYKELPSKNIDTGCGLERMACVMQGAETNYDTDLFLPLIHATEELTSKSYHGEMAFKVIADHLRSVTFALADGATFSNLGRGYVLRRLVRRATRYGRSLGMHEAFLYKLVPTVIAIMSSFYPYLIPQGARISRAIKSEEDKFLKTLDQGEKRLADYVATGANEIPAEVAFQLYDTFGYPLELTEEAAGEAGLSVDAEGFKTLLSEQKSRARAARGARQSMGSQHADYLAFKEPSRFIGYETLSTSSDIIALFKEGVRESEASGVMTVVTRETPFYAESGGECADQGTLSFDGLTYAVTDCQKLPCTQHGLVIDTGTAILHEGDEVELAVDPKTRARIEANHSATHLLNLALRTTISPDIYQHGSFVGPDGLHFDFNHDVMLSEDELVTVERFVKTAIAKNDLALIREMPLSEAKKLGAQMVFTEKYGSRVRVVTLGDSTEFCGGCHVSSTGDIGDFLVTGLENKGSGIYRLSAVAGASAPRVLQEIVSPLRAQEQELVTSLAALGEKSTLPAARNDLSYATIKDAKERIARLKDLVKEAEKRQAKKAAADGRLDPEAYASRAVRDARGFFLVTSLDGALLPAVKDLADSLLSQGPGVVFLADITPQKTLFLAKSSLADVDAGALIKTACLASGGKGGGKPDFAQGATSETDKATDALEAVRKALGLS